MGFLSKLRGLFSGEAKAVDFSAEMWAALNGGGGLPTNSGAKVSTSTALQVTPFYRGIVVIAEGIAQLPVEIYRKSGKGSEPAVDHPLYDVLLHQPNMLQDSFQYFRTTLMHAAATGMGCSYKVIVQGQVRELIPIRPESVSIDINRLFERRYDVLLENGDMATVKDDQIFHLSGPSWAPHKALDPTVVGREAIGLARATEETHARLHANGTRPSGVLSTEQKLTQDQVNRLREQWVQTNSGLSSVGKTPILGGGMKWTPTAQSGVDSEHLDTRKMQIEEIARLLGLFPIMLGHAGDQSPTFASAEAFFAAHVRYSLQPWIKAVVKAIETQLLTKEERAAGYCIRIDTSELLRGSLKDRTDYYSKALGTNSSPGWLKPNEVREDDGWNPVDGLDDVMSPLTMAPAGQPAPAPADPTLPAVKKEDENGI